MSPEAALAAPKEAPKSLDTRAIITVSARLAQVLAEEVDLLGAMKVSQIEKLQNEKIFLTNALEAQKKLIARHPYMLEKIPSQDKHDLEEVAELLDNVLAENHRKLMIAKAVNHSIVQAITSVVKDHSKSKTYDDRGFTGMAPYESLSVTLNQTI